MEYVIEQEARKVLESELKKARLLRQKQVRQQASQWSEETRRKFENEKGRQVQMMTRAMTVEAEAHARARIEHLLLTHDLAVAEVGAAHRAAAKVIEAKKLREIKRLESEELAKKRGQAALIRAQEERVQKAQAQVEAKQRKENILKEEDQKVKELFKFQQRKPLSTLTSDANKPIESKQYVKPSKNEKAAGGKLSYPTKSPAKKTFLRRGQGKKASNAAISKFVSMPGSASSQVPPSRTPSKVQTPKKPPTGGFAAAARKKSGQFDSVKVKNSDSRTVSSTSTSKTLKAPASELVRYYHEGHGKSEGQYISPVGLAEKLEPTTSPDSWSKAVLRTKMSLSEVEKKAKEQEEFLKKATERGKKANKKAHLENQLALITNELMQGEESYERLGTGNQIALLGLSDKSSEESIKTGTRRVSADSDQQYMEMSSDFAAGESDFYEESLESKAKKAAKANDDMFLELSSSEEDEDTLTSFTAPPMITTVKGKKNTDQVVKALKKPGTPRPGRDVIIETRPKPKVESPSPKRIISLNKLRKAADQREKAARKKKSSDEFLEITSDFSAAGADDTSTSVEGQVQPKPMRKKPKAGKKSAAEKAEKKADKDVGTGTITPPSGKTHRRSHEDGEHSTVHPPSQPRAPTTELTPGQTHNHNEKHPDGPYTSTPDGKLKLKISKLSTQSQPSRKDIILDHIVSAFILRKPESIQNLQVSSSSSSDLKIDSCQSLSPHTLSSSTGFSSNVTPRNVTTSGGSTSGSRTKSSLSSGNTTWKTILEERTVIKDSSAVDTSSGGVTGSFGSSSNGSGQHRNSSGSTIAEAHVKTYLSTPPDSSSLSNGSKRSSNGGGGANSFRTLQSQTLHELRKELNTLSESSEPTGTSDPTRDSNGSVIETDDEGSLMNISMAIKDIKSRQKDTNKDESEASGGSEDVEKEVRRIQEFVGDLSDCGDLWQSPPLHGSKIHDDIVSSVFEQLKDDWAGIMPIDRPPWCR